MNRHLTLAAAVFAGALLAATPPAAAAPLDESAVAVRVAGAPASAPGEDGLVLFEGHYYRLADGLLSHRHQRLLRVTSEWALERLADPRLRFDGARQRIEVHAARTYFPNGEYIDSPANAFNTVTPGELAQAPDFLDIQELVITHTGIEPGCCLWLDTESIDTAPAGLPEGALLFPQGEFPVLEMEVIAEGLNSELINPEGGLLALPAGQRDGERTRWHFAKLPAAPGQATYRLGDQLPHLNFSPLANWEQVVQAVGSSLEAAATDTACLDAWIAQVECNLERPFLDDRDAIVAILAALGDRTRLLDGPDWAWRAPRSVARVLETSIATPLERAALMIAACRTRGLPTSLELPCLWLDHGSPLLPLAALKAPWLQTGGGVGRFSPGEGRLRGNFEILGPLVYRERELRREPADLHRFMATNDQYWDLTDGSFTLSTNFAPVGHWDGIRTPETALREWCEGWTDSSRVETLSLRGIHEIGVAADVKGKAPLPGAEESGCIRLRLPMTPVDLAALLPPGMQRAQSTWRAVLFPPEPVELHLSWILDLPADLDAVAAPTLGANCPGARFTATRTQVGRRLTVHYDLEWSGAPVPPADYPAFRAFINAALDPQATQILLLPRRPD